MVVKHGIGLYFLGRWADDFVMGRDDILALSKVGLIGWGGRDVMIKFGLKGIEG